MVRPGFVVSVHGEAPNFEIHKCEGKMDSSQREREIGIGGVEEGSVEEV